MHSRLGVVIFCQNHLFLGIGAAYARAIAVLARRHPPGADALNPGDFFGVLLVGSAQHFTLVGPGGGQQPLVVHAGDHVLHLSVAVFIFHAGIERFDAGGQNDRPHVDFQLLGRLLEIYGAGLTHAPADVAFFLFKVKAAFIDVRDEGNRLRKVYVDGFVLRYSLIEFDPGTPPGSIPRRSCSPCICPR